MVLFRAGALAVIGGLIVPQTGSGQGTLRARWLSSNPRVAVVNKAGLVTAVHEGVTEITATSEGVSGTSTLTVEAGTILQPPTHTPWSWILGACALVPCYDWAKKSIMDQVRGYRWRNRPRIGFRLPPLRPLGLVLLLAGLLGTGTGIMPRYSPLGARGPAGPLALA